VGEGEGKEGEGKGRDGRGRDGRERRGKGWAPKLLVNPSENCYATDSLDLSCFLDY